MPETMTHDPSVHGYGLETGPAATLDMSGAPTEIRGLNEVGGLREAAPHGSKSLQEFEFGERQVSPVEKGLGEVAVEAAQQGVPEQANETGDMRDANLEGLREAGEVGEYFAELYEAALIEDPRLGQVRIAPQEVQNMKSLGRRLDLQRMRGRRKAVITRSL